jgi:hypothetical protein
MSDKSEEERLPPPAAVFSDFIGKPKKSSSEVQQPKRVQKEIVVPATVKSQRELVQRLKQASLKRVDFVPYYRPSDDWMGSSSGEGDRPTLQDLAALMMLRVGCVWFATNEMAGDAVRNWHQFCDPDKPDKPVKDDKIKGILDFAVKTDLKNSVHQWLRWERGMGTAFQVKYWTNKDKDVMSEPPPNRPPRKFRAFSPRFMTPINLNKSNELDYQQDVWKFSGGVFAKFSIHQDRVDVLSTRPEEGNWRGLSICEPVWISLMGYFQNFIYIVKAFRKWGEQIPVLHSGDSLPEPDEIDDLMDLMDQFEMNWKWAVGKDDKLEIIQTQIGKGIGEAMEQFKEDISSAWRIPLNQLFGRSVGGGLQGAGALVSKEDYLQQVSNIQMSLNDDLLRIYRDAGFEVDQWDIMWNMAVKKTDEQRLKEEGMTTQNKILEEQLKNQKIQRKILELQYEQMQWQSLMGEEGRPGEEEGEEGETKYESEEPEKEETQSKLSDFKKAMSMTYDECMKQRTTQIKANHPELTDEVINEMAKERCRRRSANYDFWRSIHIENKIVFPYGGK